MFWLYFRQVGCLNSFQQLYCQGLCSFNLKRLCYSYVWFRILYEGGTSLCTKFIFRKTQESYLFFQLTLLLWLSYFFFIIYQSLRFWARSNLDEFLSFKPSANIFVFGDANVNYKDWLANTGRSDILGELCWNAPFSLYRLWTILVLIWMVLLMLLIWEMFQGKIYLSFVFLLMLLIF